jgi:hypothetical protein
MQTSDNNWERRWKKCPDPRLWKCETLPPNCATFPITTDGYIIKSGKAPLNECAAYQLAEFLDIPVPDHFFFLASDEMRDQGICDKGTVNIAIEKLPETRDSADVGRIAQFSSALAATYLAFASFDRGHEWPSVILMPDRCALIDFEGQFPRFDTDESMSEYRKYANCSLNACLEKAVEVGIVAEFNKHLVQMVARIVNSEFRPSFGLHPKAEDLSSFFQKAISQRANFLIESQRI